MNQRKTALLSLMPMSVSIALRGRIMGCLRSGPNRNARAWEVSAERQNRRPLEFDGWKSTEVFELDGGKRMKSS